MERKNKATKLEDLDVEQVTELLQRWQMEEFQDLVREKQVNGRKLMDVTEGLVKLWRPKMDAKKLILFVEDLKLNPGKYFGEKYVAELQVECQYQTVKKTKQESTSSTVSVEEMLKKLVPAKSFLYRNRSKQSERIPSYLPMDAGTRKPRKFFRLSSYEYPNFDILSKFSKSENQEDRGYYSVKTSGRYFIHETYKNQDSRTKYKSLPTSEEGPEMLEDHFYEDLCYNEVKNDESKNSLKPVNVKPCLVKLQELFNSFKMPFFKRPLESAASVDVKTDETVKNKELDTNLYENSDFPANMYDSVRVSSRVTEVKNSEELITVEDYLEPVSLNKDYCDVGVRQKEESLLGYLMSLFEQRFGIKKVYNVTRMCWVVTVSVPLLCNLGTRVGDSFLDFLYKTLHCFTDVITETSDPNQSEDSDTDEKANDSKTRQENDKMEVERVHKMADRPLPVPVENEPYYMNVDRSEAENLLKGQPDGTFILRPSSQSNHAYTLSVSCACAVHNVGVRRRPDGRLALGFPRRGERSFGGVPSLLRHHRRRRLLLVAAGGVLGATTLTESPHYYQTPTNLPVIT